MKKLIKQLLKFKKIIFAITLLGCIGLAVVFCIVLEHKRAYSASVRIELSDLNTETGKMPDDTVFDGSEITSTEVLNSVRDDLGIDITSDKLRSGFKVSEYLKSDEKDLKDAMISDAQEYTTHANTYTVSYTGESDMDQAEVQNILNATVFYYQEWYKTHYLSSFKLLDDSKDVGNGYGYEWITAVDTLSDELTSLKEYSDAKAEWEGNFRSSTTDLTYSEISKQIENIESVYIDKMYATIYQGKYCKDLTTLLQYYQTELETETNTQTESTEQAERTKELMDIYAEKLTTMNQGVGSDNSSTDTEKMILGEVEEKVQNGAVLDVDTTYDKLTSQYMEYKIAAAKSGYKIDHYNMILTLYSSDATLSDYTGIDVTDCEAKSEEWLSETIEKAAGEISALFGQLKETTDDYLAQQVGNKVLITNVSYSTANLNVSLYSAIAVVLCVGIFVSAVVIVKFLEEISKEEAEDEN